MKMNRKIAAAVAASLLLVCMAPAAAFATGASAADAMIPMTITAESGAPSAAVSGLADDSVANIFRSDVNAFSSYAIGTLDGNDFVPVTSVSKNTSELAVRLYFVPSEVQRTEELTLNGRISIGGDFATQGTIITVPNDANYIQMDNLKYVGTTDSRLAVSILNSAGQVTKTFDTVNISECEVTPTATATPEATANPEASTPGLIVRASSIGASSIKAGEKFNLSLTIYATSSGSEALNDVLVSIAPDKGVTLVSGSSSQYVGTMAAGATQTITFPMQASSSFTEGVSSIAVALSAIGAKSGAATTGSTNIAVPVDQPDRFEISKLECPESIVIGEEEVCTIYFVNKGKNSVANLTVSLSAENLTSPIQSSYVGNLSAGTEDSVDFDLSGVAEGNATGTITLTYEGSDGTPVTLTQDISTVVEAGMSYDDMFGGDYMGEDVYAPIEEEKPGLPLAVKILIGVAAAAVVIVLVVVLKKRQAKKKARLEAEDEDL